MAGSTKKFIPIRDVKENVLILKDGRMCSILLASSVNFALKSRDEQEAILSRFQSFLNTLDFSLQFYIQSRRLDIEPYLAQLRARENFQDNDLMRIQLREYVEFIRTFVAEVDIMSKNFFVVVPYTPTEINFKAGIGSLFGGQKQLVIDDSRFQEKRTQLEQRTTLVQQGLNGMGVRTVALESEALVELYYHIFNPRDAHQQVPLQRS